MDGLGSLKLAGIPGPKTKGGIDRQTGGQTFILADRLLFWPDRTDSGSF